MDDVLDNLPWHALNSDHARFAQSAPLARKYRSDIAPFAGTLNDSPESFRQLHDLLTPGEAIYVMGNPPPPAFGLTCGEGLPCLQMLAHDVPKQPYSTNGPEPPIVRLSPQHAGAMVELTGLAFPGFFRTRTHEMGVYYGIHSNGQLVAMAGERMAIPHYREISGVCTHPAHTGKGFAARLISHLMQEHTQAGVQSLLHATSTNTRAIDLYKRLGFVVRTEIVAYPLTRAS